MGSQQMFGLNMAKHHPTPRTPENSGIVGRSLVSGLVVAGPWVFNTSDGGIPALQRSSLTSELFPCKTRGNQGIIKMALSKNGEYDDQPLVFGVRKQWYHVFMVSPNLKYHGTNTSLLVRFLSDQHQCAPDQWFLLLSGKSLGY